MEERREMIWKRERERETEIKKRNHGIKAREGIVKWRMQCRLMIVVLKRVQQPFTKTYPAFNLIFNFLKPYLMI